MIGEGLKESPVKEIVAGSESVGIDEQREEESLRCKREVCYPSLVERPH